MAAFVGLGFLLLAGEEISWAQRIFDIETPSTLERINAQKELNLHNLRGLRPALNGALLLTSTLLLVLTRLRPRWVPTYLAPAFCVTPLYWFSRLFSFRFDSLYVIRNGEWAELSLGIGLLLLMRHTARFFRERAPSPPGDPG